MSSFANTFSTYTMTQLNGILEDDEKVSNMIQETEEVTEREGIVYCNDTAVVGLS